MTGQDRRRFIQGSVALAGLGLLSGCGLVSVPGLQPVRLRRIGYLDAGTNTPLIEPVRAGLRDLGYVEGQTFVIEYRNAEGRLDRLPVLADELIRVPVELIVTREASASLAASQATSTLPIVVSGGDVVAAGLVSNIAHPEKNMTGVTTNTAEVTVKWVELLKETVPTLSRLAVVVDPSAPVTPTILREARRAAQALQLRLMSYDLPALDQLAALLTTVRADGAEGLMVAPGGILGGGTNPRIGDEVLKSRLPSVASTREFALNGGLLVHAANVDVLARRSAGFVDKLLKGTRPGDLPIELPTVFDIVVNLKSAQALGITIPSSVLQRATEVIQ